LKSVLRSVNVCVRLVNAVDPAVTISNLQQLKETGKPGLLPLHFQDNMVIMIRIICRPSGHPGFFCTFPAEVPEAAVLYFSVDVTV
jgi:hypothetical protein